VRALLAGGLVLGVGAAITLAAWNDSEFATGLFTAGHFDMEGSTDGTTFASHTTAPGASLALSTGFDNLSPTDVVAAPFVLHLDAATSTDATVTVTSATTAVSDTAATTLTYGVIQVTSVLACTPTATGTEIVAAGTSFDATPVSATVDLAKSVDGTLVGEDAFLCVQVTASDLLEQDTSATGTWEFVAVSATP
jgi:predicted ribosomally synthesized peptide with SipW-like signal peptide